MRILILGIGNVMFGDEGFGVHFVRWAKECFSWEFEKTAAASSQSKQNSPLQKEVKNEEANCPRKPYNTAKTEFAKTEFENEVAAQKREICFIDGGTLATALSGLIAEFDEVVVVDCIDADEAKSGDLFFFPFSAMPPQINWSGSAHELEMLHTLAMLDLAGDLPQTHILAVVPNRVEPMTFELSKEVQECAQSAYNTLKTHLSKLGVKSHLVRNLTLQDVANSWKNPLFCAQNEAK